MKFLKYLISFALIIFFTSCFSNKNYSDVEFREFDVADLKEDLAIFKGIVFDMHAGAFIYNSPAELEYIFDSINRTLSQPLTTREFYNKIDFIVDKLNCLHSVTFLPDIYFDSIINRAIFFPTPLIDIDNRLYANTDIQKIPLGAEILSINSISAIDIIKKMRTYYHTDGIKNFARSSAIDEDFALNYFLAYGGAQDFTIEFKRDSVDTIETKVFFAEKLKDINYEIDNTTFFYYPKDVGYDLEIDDKRKAATLTIRTFSFKSYNSEKAYNNFLQNSFRLIRQNNIKNLIIDCRNNSGGYYSASYGLLSYLVNKPLQESDSIVQRFKELSYTEYVAVEDTGRIAEEDTAYYACSKIRKGLYKVNDSEIKRWEPQKNIYNGNIFVIINSNAMSATAAFVSVLKANIKATVIGEETGGGNDAHNAASLTFELPKTKIKLNIPLRRFYHPVVSNQWGRGVIPDKEIRLTKIDLINNVDGPASYIFDSILVK